MSTHERPTPETFAALVDHMPEGEQSWSHHYLQLSSFARRLERQRDEALDRVAELEKQLAELQKPKERDTFEAYGEIWIKHTPGGPMPRAGETFVMVLSAKEKEKMGPYRNVVTHAIGNDWSNYLDPEEQIIGWNYSDDMDLRSITSP